MGARTPAERIGARQYLLNLRSDLEARDALDRVEIVAALMAVEPNGWHAELADDLQRRLLDVPGAVARFLRRITLLPPA
jgi:hypothetical protein